MNVDSVRKRQYIELVKQLGKRNIQHNYDNAQIEKTDNNDKRAAINKFRNCKVLNSIKKNTNGEICDNKENGDTGDSENSGENGDNGDNENNGDSENNGKTYLTNLKREREENQWNKEQLKESDAGIKAEKEKRNRTRKRNEKVDYMEDKIELRIEKTNTNNFKKKTIKYRKCIKTFLLSNNIPIFSPRLIIFIPFCISIFFFIMSFFLLYKIQNIIECSVSYPSPIYNNQDAENDNPFYRYIEEILYIKITQYDCKGIEGDKQEITIEDNLYLYYQINNFYQNDRSYMKNINESKQGIIDCDLYYKFNNENVSMCSLKILSMFNDSFSLFQNIIIERAPGNVDEVEGITNKNLYWHGNNDIRDNKIDIELEEMEFNNRDLQSVNSVMYMGNNKINRTVIPQNEIELEENILNTGDFNIYKEIENEQNKKILKHISSMFFNNKEIVEDHLCIWLTNSVSKNIKKPYAKINAKTLKFPFYVQVYNRYSVESFEGKKHIFITTISNFGSRNFFLFYLLLVNAFIFLIMAIFFFVQNSKNIRIIGDARHFLWKRYD